MARQKITCYLCYLPNGEVELHPSLDGCTYRVRKELGKVPAFVDQHGNGRHYRDKDLNVTVVRKSFLMGVRK